MVHSLAYTWCPETHQTAGLHSGVVRITVSPTLCHSVTYLHQEAHNPLGNTVPTALDLIPVISLNPRAGLERDAMPPTPLNQPILPPTWPPYPSKLPSLLPVPELKPHTDQ